MKNYWKSLGYQGWDGGIEDRLVELRERDGNYGLMSGHGSYYVWMIRKEYAIDFEFDLSHDSAEQSFKEGRFWHTGLWWGLILNEETDREAVIRIALTSEGIAGTQTDRWEVKEIGPKCYTIKERGPAQQAEYDKQALQCISRSNPGKKRGQRL